MTAHILVVDDEADLETLILQKFRREIRSGDIEFHFARDGIEALSVIDHNAHIEMVVSDINMPRMDGLTLLDKLQQSKEELSTVIVSAYGDMANIRTAINRGAFDFLTKPIDFSDFESTISKTLRHIDILRKSKQRLLAAERAQAALSRYFSPNIATQLAADLDGMALAGQWRELTSLFTDIEGFTSLVETLEPDVLGQLINDYLSGVTDIVFECGGTVAKIVGDALHVLFGAPWEQVDHAAKAVDCALRMDAFTQAFRCRWLENGVALGVTRIGVHSGRALVGNFGGRRYFDYTAYGDTINTTARLETANKQLGIRLCVSAAVAEQVRPFYGRPIGDLVLRGRVEPLRAFEPYQSGQLDAALVREYQDAFEKLEGGSAAALPAFASLVSKLPDDPLASFHLKRLLNGARDVRIVLD